MTERPAAGNAASAATIVKIAAGQGGCSVPTAAPKDGPPETAVATRKRETPPGARVKRRIPAEFTTDAYIEQLGENLRLDLPHGQAQPCSPGRLRLHPVLYAPGRRGAITPSRRHTGHQLVPDHSSWRDHGPTGRRQHLDHQGGWIGGPAHIRHHGHPHPGSTSGDEPPPEKFYIKTVNYS